MDPSQSNDGQDSQGQFPGGNNGAYQPGWNPFMYGYQCPPGWLPQGLPPPPLVQPTFPMMNPTGYAPEGFRQAEIAEPSVHHFEADVVEVPTPTSNQRKKSGGTSTKLANFSPDEDTNLVKSWLEISCDPITSTRQKKQRMWDRIIQRYNSRRASSPERTLRSLQSRWDIIRAEVTLFASYYADSIRENASGMSDADKTTHAVGNFAAVLGRKFGYLHCWEIMKDAPKWQDPNAREMAAAARGQGFGEKTAAEDKSTPVGCGAQASRPMGRDSAKAAKKKANSDAVQRLPQSTQQECKICLYKKFLSCKRKLCVKMNISSSLPPSMRCVLRNCKDTMTHCCCLSSRSLSSCVRRKRNKGPERRRKRMNVYLRLIHAHHNCECTTKLFKTKYWRRLQQGAEGLMRPEQMDWRGNLPVCVVFIVKCSSYV